MVIDVAAIGTALPGNINFTVVGMCELRSVSNNQLVVVYSQEVRIVTFVFQEYQDHATVDVDMIVYFPS